MQNLSCNILRENLHKLSANDQAFALKMLSANETQSRGLSDKQQSCVNTLIDRIKGVKEVQRDGTAGKPQRETVALSEAGFAKMIAIFDNAAKTGKGSPVIKIADESGDMLVINMAAPGTSQPGTLNVKSPGAYGENKWYGRILRDGHFEKSPRETMSASLLALLQAFAANPAETAAAYGKRTERCCFCNTKITREASKAVGYGPDCADRYGLPWG